MAEERTADGERQRGGGDEQQPEIPGGTRPPIATAEGPTEPTQGDREIDSSGSPGDVDVPATEQPQLAGEPTLDPQLPTTADESTATVADAAPSGELEELILPSSIEAPKPLDPETALGPDGRLRIVEYVGVQGRVNHYAALWRDDAGQDVPVELREAPSEHLSLARAAEVLASVRYGMLPTCYASFEQDGRRYLAIERLEGDTLEQALRASLDLETTISIALQLAQALRRLHQAGWALVGLGPADVRLGQPLRLAKLGSATRIGEAPPEALHLPGYSAPELTYRAVVSGKEDVYTLGAILFRALAGQPLPESGAELAALPLLVQVPGGPQLLALALAPVEERVDLEAFYHQLLAFKQRLARRPIALELASATSVGLNPTRPLNEDSCVNITWSVAEAEGVSHRALLCVADGMGGMDAGEVASRTALRVVMNGALAPSPALDPVALIRQAAPAVHEAGQGRQMGTTATCVVVQDGELTLGHVGDTRAYLLRDGVLTQLTEDHSLVAAMVASGVLTKEEARGHPDSNKVLRSLGSQRELPERYVDDLADAYGEPTLQLRPRDWLLLCTDGVWGSVDDEQLRIILSEAIDPPTAARAMIERALRAGAPDNAAAVVARCVEMPAR